MNGWLVFSAISTRFVWGLIPGNIMPTFSSASLYSLLNSYLWRWRSWIKSFLYNLWVFVLRLSLQSYIPSLRVPPLSLSADWSGRKWMMYFVGETLFFSSNSSDVISLSLSIARANSIVIICIPRHRPRYGMFFSRAYRAAVILPSIPREPNPPGIRIPSADFRDFHVFSSFFSSFSVFIQRRSSSRCW